MDTEEIVGLIVLAVLTTGFVCIMTALFWGDSKGRQCNERWREACIRRGLIRWTIDAKTGDAKLVWQDDEECP